MMDFFRSWEKTYEDLMSKLKSCDSDEKVSLYYTLPDDASFNLTKAEIRNMQKHLKSKETVYFAFRYGKKFNPKYLVLLEGSDVSSLAISYNPSARKRFARNENEEVGKADLMTKKDFKSMRKYLNQTMKLVMNFNARALSPEFLKEICSYVRKTKLNRAPTQLSLLCDDTSCFKNLKQFDDNLTSLKVLNIENDFLARPLHKYLRYGKIRYVDLSFIATII